MLYLFYLSLITALWRIRIAILSTEGIFSKFLENIYYGKTLPGFQNCCTRINLLFINFLKYPCIVRARKIHNLFSETLAKIFVSTPFLLFFALHVIFIPKQISLYKLLNVLRKNSFKELIFYFSFFPKKWILVYHLWY